MITVHHCPNPSFAVLENGQSTVLDLRPPPGQALGIAVHGEVERRVSLQSIRELAEHGLKEREATVIRMRYGLMDGKAYAQQEVAERLGISRSYISRIEKKALERLKEAFETGKMSRKS